MEKTISKNQILYFLGGEYYNKSNYVHKKVFQDIYKKVKTIRLLIFLWTWKITHNEYIQLLKDFFIKLGIKQIQFAKISDSKDLVIKKINSSNVLCFPGGDTSILIKQIKNKKLVNLLKEYGGIIIGNSAGALSFSKEGFWTEYKDNKIIDKKISGFGLVNFNIMVHYDGKVNDKYLKRYSKNRKIYAISEKSALIYENNKIRTIGKVYEFYKGKKIKIQ